MMFKIISKKRYEKLCEENEMLHKELDCMVAERNGIVTNHVCHEVFCKDCSHAVIIENHFGFETRVFCDLDRHCKDYAKKYLTEKDNA